jgi:adenine/guanine phosphoribosyltransferase-like PRPP-binding protein
MIYGSHRSLPDDMEAYKSFRDLDLTVEQTLRTLKVHKDDFDAIIVRGISGIVVGAPVALIMGKTLVVVRKEDESSHDQTGNVIGKGDLNATSRLLFLDDLISSGSTRRECERAIAPVEHENEEYNEEFGRVVAYYVYERDTYTPKGKYDFGGEY